MEFAGGDLTTPFSNSVILTAANTVINSGSNKLTMIIAKPSGLFTGSVALPESGKTLPFKGAILQKQNVGCGYTLGLNQSGRMVLQPGPASTEGQ